MTTARLQRELKKKRPFDAVEQEVALGIVRTSDQLQHRFTRLFRDFGLTPSQYNVLRILRGEGQPLPILEIASRTITVVPGITGLIDRLEEAGLVSRQRCAEDRRVIYVSLTAKAAKLLASIDQPLLDLHKRLLRGVAAGELRQLGDLLEKVRTSIAGEPE
ncbi:MAG TPA: MarR family transcriptional regulator [Pirellulales bacterium]|nr:MarR family transcriptional regulator [Pirellulales bacterium]